MTFVIQSTVYHGCLSALRMSLLSCHQPYISVVLPSTVHLGCLTINRTSRLSYHQPYISVVFLPNVHHGCLAINHTSRLSCHQPYISVVLPSIVHLGCLSAHCLLLSSYQCSRLHTESGGEVQTAGVEHGGNATHCQLWLRCVRTHVCVCVFEYVCTYWCAYVYVVHVCVLICSCWYMWRLIVDWRSESTSSHRQCVGGVPVGNGDCFVSFTLGVTSW